MKKKNIGKFLGHSYFERVKQREYRIFIKYEQLK